MSRAEDILESADALIASLVELDEPTIEELATLSIGLVSVVDRLQAAHAKVLRSAEHAGVVEFDGSTTLAAFVAPRAATSKARVSRVVSLGRFLDRHPVLAGAALEGSTSAAHIDVLRAAAKTKLQKTSLCEHETQETLLGYADEFGFDDWRRVIGHWQEVVDPDGAENKAAEAHEGRQFKLLPVLGGGYLGELELGNLDGLFVNEAVARLADEMFRQDVAEARERLGREPSLDELPRDPKARRADALAELVRRGSAASPSITSVLPIVNLHMDWDTYQAGLDWLAGNPEAFTNCDPTLRVCEDLDGNPVTPGEAIQAMLDGHVRRIVFGAESEVINYGRKKRLFTGAAREAALQIGRYCQHPGCRRPVRWCQVDHVVAWANDGPTDLANAQLLCGYHNRWKFRNIDRAVALVHS